MSIAQTVLRRFVTPSSALIGQRDRSQARLLMALLMVFIATVIVIWLVPFFEGKDGYVFSEMFWLRLGMVFSVLVAYGISRTPYFRLSVWLSIFSINLLTYYLALAGDDSKSEERLVYLSISVLFAILFLRIRWAGLVAILNILSMVLYGLYNDKLSDIKTQIGFVTLSSAIILVIWLHQRELLRQQSNEIKERDTRYRQLVDLNPDAIVVFDREGIRYLNQAAADMYNVPSPSSIMGKKWNDIWLPKYAPRIHQRAQVVMNHTGIVREAIDRAVMPDGRKMTLEVSTAPIRYEGNDARLLIARDISGRIENENRLLLIHQAIESTSDAVCITDMQGRAIYKNDAFDRLLGLQKASERRDILRLFASPRQGMIIYREMRKGIAWQGEATLRHRLGRDVPVLLRANIIHNKEQVPIGMIAVATDISQQKIIDEARIQIQVEQERVRLLEEFIRDVSHDFKTPLSVINMKLYLLEKLLTNDRQKKHLGILGDQVKRVEMLIESIFLMMRVDRGDMTTLVEVDLNQIIQLALRECEPLIEEKDIRTELSLADDLPILMANATELHRVYMNLLDNALHYTPNAGRVTVTTLYLPDKRVIISEVSDTGIGVGENDLPHIFERFYRADKARQMQTGGAGLGLAIASKIIERHGGLIEAESIMGEGTTFRITFDLDYLAVARQKAKLEGNK